MPARRRAPQRRQRPLAFDSGATGGPATARGTNYQINFAIAEAIRLIEGLLLTYPPPDPRPFIQMEPREVSGEATTRWDILVAPDDTLTEAKVAPSRSDILEWLDHVKSAAAATRSKRFRLAFGATHPLLKSLRSLRRVAVEAGDDADQFERLVERENIPQAEEILEHLGDPSPSVLRRIELDQRDEAALDREIDLRLRYLVKPRHVDRVRDFLFRRFAAEMSRRGGFLASSLKAEIEGLGVAFSAPSEIEPTGLSPEAHRAFFVLQNSPQELPDPVLAAVVGCSSAKLMSVMNAFLENGEVVHVDDCWRISPLLSVRLAHPRGQDLLAEVVRRLLTFVKDNQTTEAGRGQIDNLVTFARKCEASHGAVVAGIFAPLDKILKRTGRKKLVFEVASIVIRCSQRADPRDEALLRAEAKALICGLSWVYQRLDKLDEAEAHARRSLALGEALGWGRNTAFCHKCIGRLRRIQAEREPDSRKRKRLLQDSEIHLQEAVKAFTKERDFGAGSEEVGDCHSLLGRTYLTGRRLTEAQDAAKKAAARLKDPTSKDYMDLLILRGDLAAAKFKYKEADRLYGEALELLGSGDAERSEIAARTYLRRGMNKSRCGEGGASDDIRHAARIWKDLEEEYLTAEAEWEALLVEKRVEPTHLSRLSSECPAVRVESVRQLERRREAAPKALSFRGEIPDLLMDKLIRDARVVAEVRHKEWIAP